MKKKLEDNYGAECYFASLGLGFFLDAVIHLIKKDLGKRQGENKTMLAYDRLRDWWSKPPGIPSFAEWIKRDPADRTRSSGAFILFLVLQEAAEAKEREKAKRAA